MIVLNQLIANDNTVANFLLSDQLQKTARVLINYMAAENDYRGFVFEGSKGRALFYENLSDLLNTIIKHPRLATVTKFELVQHFFTMYRQRNQHFIYNEERALANTIVTLQTVIPSLAANITSELTKWQPETVFSSTENLASFYNKKRLEQALKAHN